MTDATWPRPKAVCGSDDRLIIYSDCGPLVAYVRGAADRHHADTIRVFDAVRRSDYRLITSPMGIAETIGVTRKRTATSHRCRPGTAKICGMWTT